MRGASIIVGYLDRGHVMPPATWPHNHIQERLFIRQFWLVHCMTMYVGILQLLVAGCHDAVRVLRVHIDDASKQSSDALAAALERVAAGEEPAVDQQSIPGPHDGDANASGREVEEDEHLTMHMLCEVSVACSCGPCLGPKALPLSTAPKFMTMT